MSNDDYQFIEYLLNDIDAQREWEHDPKTRELLNKLSSAAANLLQYVESKED